MRDMILVVRLRVTCLLFPGVLYTATCWIGDNHGEYQPGQ